MRMRKILVVAVLVSFLVPIYAWAAARDFAVKASVTKNTYLKTEPIYMDWMVTNMGDDALPLYIQTGPNTYQPRISYGLQVRSISNNSVNTVTTGTLSPSVVSVSPHSDMVIQTNELRSVFGSQLNKGHPGVYRVTIIGSWIVGTTTTDVFTFMAEADFIILGI